MKFVAETGYDGLEIAPFTIAKYVTEIPAPQRRTIRDTAARHQLEISGIHWVLAQTEGFHLTHPDPEVRARTTQYLCDLIDFGGDIGARSMIVGSPKQRNVLPGVSQEEAWAYATDAFRRPVMRAEQREMTICFEPLAPSETNFINTADRAIEFVQQLNTPHFRIILDVKAMSSEAKPITQIIRDSWPHFAYFHANDQNLKGPGFGNTDFRPIGSVLREVGYRGYVSVEVFDFSEGPERIARESLQHLRETFGPAGS